MYRTNADGEKDPDCSEGPPVPNIGEMEGERLHIRRDEVSMMIEEVSSATQTKEIVECQQADGHC